MVAGGEARNAVPREPLEHGIAVPGRDQLGHSAGPRRLAMPDDAEAEEDRDDREPAILVLRDEVLDGCEDAVAWPALLGRRPPIGQAARAHARLAGEEAAALGDRLPVLVGYR